MRSPLNRGGLTVKAPLTGRTVKSNVGESFSLKRNVFTNGFNLEIHVMKLGAAGHGTLSHRYTHSWAGL
jgi:hypothetical protein